MWFLQQSFNSGRNLKSNCLCAVILISVDVLCVHLYTHNLGSCISLYHYISVLLCLVSVWSVVPLCAALSWCSRVFQWITAWNIQWWEENQNQVLVKSLISLQCCDALLVYSCGYFMSKWSCEVAERLTGGTARSFRQTLMIWNNRILILIYSSLKKRLKHNVHVSDPFRVCSFVKFSSDHDYEVMDSD